MKVRIQKHKYEHGVLYLGKLEGQDDTFVFKIREGKAENNRWLAFPFEKGIYAKRNFIALKLIEKEFKKTTEDYIIYDLQKHSRKKYNISDKTNELIQEARRVNYAQINQ